LKRIFDMKDISVLIRDFVNAIPYSSSVKLLNIEKLQFMHKLIFSDLLSQQGKFSIFGIVKIQRIAGHDFPNNSFST
jgi:hypothetical protein